MISQLHQSCLSGIELIQSTLRTHTLRVLMSSILGFDRISSRISLPPCRWFGNFGLASHSYQEVQLTDRTISSMRSIQKGARILINDFSTRLCAEAFTGSFCSVLSIILISAQDFACSIDRWPSTTCHWLRNYCKWSWTGDEMKSYLIKSWSLVM